MATGHFATQAARAFALVARMGAPVVFTLTGRGPHDPATGTVAGLGVTRTVEGSAVRVSGDPLVYQALSLIESDAPTLFVVPTVYGETPPLGASVPFGGVAYVVANVAPVAPDGVTIAARVVVTGSAPVGGG